MQLARADLVAVWGMGTTSSGAGQLVAMLGSSGGRSGGGEVGYGSRKGLGRRQHLAALFQPAGAWE